MVDIGRVLYHEPNLHRIIAAAEIASIKGQQAIPIGGGPASACFRTAINYQVEPAVGFRQTVSLYQIA
jgi:hypothetical protein